MLRPNLPTTVYVSSLSLMLVLVGAGCGGSGDETRDDEAASRSGDPAPMAPGGDDAVGDDTAGDPGEDGASEPGSDGPGMPSDDGMADPPGPAVTAPGTGVVSPPSTGSGMLPPAPTEPAPAVAGCDGASCGDPCDPSGGLALLVVGPITGYCDRAGECVLGVPQCDAPAEDCTESCPVITICQLCDDQETCASPSVACNPDGSCGATTWTCPEDTSPQGNECPTTCAIPEICSVCDDGSCATATPTCNADGSCGPIDYSCPEDASGTDACESDSDCPATRIACSVCEDGTSTCPGYQCDSGQCVLVTPECGGEYQPCAGKQDGDYCTLCAPNDPACSETAELKTCVEGECRSQVFSGE